MRKIIYICIANILLSACVSDLDESKTLTYQNIVIYVDLSNRLDKIPNKDSIEIRKIVEYFKDECVKPGGKIGDRSSLLFCAFSQGIIDAIDVEDHRTTEVKQQFVNSTGRFQQSGLEHKIENFKENVKATYANTKNDGLDLISVLIDHVENKAIVKKNKAIICGRDTTNICYENHIYIFTDGYLEYKGAANNKQYYFGKDKIDSVRKYCDSNNLTIEEALEMDCSLGLPPTKHSNNTLINLHVFETHERDKNILFQTYKHPRGLRDNEILKAVWRKWAEESDFKSFEWKKY